MKHLMKTNKKSWNTTVKVSMSISNKYPSVVCFVYQVTGDTLSTLVVRYTSYKMSFEVAWKVSMKGLHLRFLFHEV